MDDSSNAGCPHCGEKYSSIEMIREHLKSCSKYLRYKDAMSEPYKKGEPKAFVDWSKEEMDAFNKKINDTQPIFDEGRKYLEAVKRNLSDIREIELVSTIINRAIRIGTTAFENELIKPEQCFPQGNFSDIPLLPIPENVEWNTEQHLDDFWNACLFSASKDTKTPISMRDLAGCNVSNICIGNIMEWCKYFQKNNLIKDHDDYHN